MRVTDKQYPMDSLLVRKLDLIIDRMTGDNKQDALVLVDGDEGIGKTTITAGICYYVSYKTGRPLSLKNVFFNLDDLIKFALETKEQIIWWDEGALAGLASEWWKKNQKKFIKLLMVARKRRHFFVICIPKFFRLNEYFVVDRSITLIHVYARNNTQLGKFVYFTKNSKEKLYNDWKRRHFRNYKQHYDFVGTFPNILGEIIDEKEYDKKKDEAILSIDKEDGRPTLAQIKKGIILESVPKINRFLKENGIEPKQKYYAEWFNINKDTMSRYNKEIKGGST